LVPQRSPAVRLRVDACHRIYADWAAGPTDDRLVPFLALITRWLAGGASVLFEEFGLPTIPVAGPDSSIAIDEDLAATYTGDATTGSPRSPSSTSSPSAPHGRARSTTYPSP
jgi:hypothetical protein